MASRRENRSRHTGHWQQDRRSGSDDGALGPHPTGRREDPDEFPGPVARSSPRPRHREGREGEWREGGPSRQDDRLGRSGLEAAYAGRYADRADGGFANYSGRPGGVSGGRYGAYHDPEGPDRYGGQYEGLSPGEKRTSWRGKGPKGYVRSDDRIREDVCDRLTDDPVLDAGNIEVDVKEGEVTLSGSVSNRGARRHAEDIVEEISGVRHLQNNLRWRDQGHAPSPASRTAGTNARPH